MSIGYFFGLFAFISVISIRLGMLVMCHFGILDRPGGHKQHSIATPFVGGFGIFAVLIGAIRFSATYFPETALHSPWALALGGLIMFVMGLADDMWRLGFRLRFVLQACVALIMIYLGGIELHSLGRLVFDEELTLGWLALPFTVFATVGVINALNMIDGIDGFSGSLSFISLGFIALLAQLVGNDAYLLLAVALMGGIAGFLAFNLRYPSNRRARVFLGDNGSMLLGFVFAWLFIALSQGEQKAMTPVTALWLLCLPLMDTVSVTLRRVRMGISPFHADRSHLHHLFLRAGFRVSDTVWIIALVHLTLAGIGIAGLLLEVPEDVMFEAFMVLFCIYFSMVARPERLVSRLRKLNVALGLPSVFSHGIFVGHFEKTVSREILELLKTELAEFDGFRLSLHRMSSKVLGSANIYGIVDVECHDDEESIGKVRRLMARIRTRLGQRPGVHVHLLMQRSRDNDRRCAALAAAATPAGQRQVDRREVLCHPAMYSAIGGKGNAPRTIAPLVESIHSA